MPDLAIRVLHGADQQAADERRYQKASVIKPGILARCHNKADDEREKRNLCHCVHMPDQVSASGNQLLYIGKAQRKCGAHEQLRRARIQSVIDASRVLTGNELQRHGNRREKCQCTDADHERLSFMRELRQP